MATAIPPLKDSEKIEFGYAHADSTLTDNAASSIIIASYNIRYARGPYLITGGLRRKVGLMNLARRAEHA